MRLRFCKSDYHTDAARFPYKLICMIAYYIAISLITGLSNLAVSLVKYIFINRYRSVCCVIKGGNPNHYAARAVNIHSCIFQMY